MRIRPFSLLLSSLSFWFPVLGPDLPVHFQEGFPDRSPAAFCGRYRPLLRWTCHSSASGRRSSRKDDKPADNFARFEKKEKRGRKAQEEPRQTKKGTRGAARMESGRQDDWRQFFQGHDIILKGEEPDFSEDGWARRKPKKKKK